jgi:16S rRNA C967 or C1407 C5-methylase (RsmB/RsmF family)/NOL1/NOP2/fmu family ribosome biogenesis protein
MVLPASLIASLRGLPGFDEAAFLDVHNRGVFPTSIRRNPAKGATLDGPSPVPWCAFGQYLFPRPSFITDPAWHTGQYYVQEASSMFLEQAYLQHASGLAAPRVLDACAAPGGKSTHLRALMGDTGLLVSNEVIRTRVGMLSENMQRWGGAGVIVSSADPRSFGSLPNFFDILLVDAPCSGSGLFRREPEAIREWSPEQVELCGARQQRILGDLWGSLKEGGLLLYSTCSYSPRENEDILGWLCGNLGAESLALSLDPAWGVVETQAPAYGYRFYPHLLEGEGLFMAVLRKTGGAWPSGGRVPVQGLVRMDNREAELARPWIEGADRFIYARLGESIRAIPEALAADMTLITSVLPVREAGVALGQLMRKELIPDQALALSGLVSSCVPLLALSREQALDYVRKDELRLEGAPRGWALVTYEGQGLGWVKVLEGRINNYYPKAWRVLKR